MLCAFTKKPLKNYLYVTVVLATLAFLPTANASTSRSIYIGAEIPKLIKTNTRLIFHNSDSLYLNDRLLVRGEDYILKHDSGWFDLSKLHVSPKDTLTVSYRVAPQWMTASFGQAVPEINSQVNASVPNSIPAQPRRLQSANLSEINISGAKTFRFSSQSSGNSDFGQSLDLNIEGELTENVKISGSISDRGYNPSYGTANSRLEELDKVNLRLESPGMSAQIGDIEMGRRLYQFDSMNKKISGAAVNVNAGNFGVSGVVARPKGRFSTFRIIASDGVQGPYQIGEGTQVKPIVPNSETVWLDGRRLVRGSDKDYLMDYPTGRITFSVRNLIDRRSRIEIDFEPVATDFKTELLSAGSAYKVGDSSFFAAVEWYREGDDKNQPRAGDLSSSDIQVLNSAGDDIAGAVRSGIKADTAGNYIFDSTALPDTVLQFVGQGNGSHIVVFSFVGTNAGAYKFAGGQQYIYVGASGGDYLPLIKIPAPERTNFYSSAIGVNNSIIGAVDARLTISQYDRNLLSCLDDANNQGLLFNLNTLKEFQTNGQVSNFQLKVRTKEADFHSSARLNTADFDRKFLTPQNFITASDERLYEAKTELSILKNVTIAPAAGRLNYRNTFSSNRFEVLSSLGDKRKLNGTLFWGTTKANMTATEINQAKSNTIMGTIAVPLSDDIKVSAEFESDRRQNSNGPVDEGLRYKRYATAVEHKSEKVSYEFYTEDSLLSDWSHFSNRNRLTGSSVRRFSKFSYNTYVGYQWLSRSDSKEQSFLGRTDLRYNNNRKQLNLEASYALSDETRNARGITYLEVEPGQGNYVLENGRYLPDPDGNFIQVEELLSDRSRVIRGEKSFLFTKNWSGTQIRFNSKIEEELLENGSREILWLLPFLSDNNQPYLVYNRQYNSDIRFIPIKGGHAVNIALDQRTEIRNLSGSARTRQDRTGSITLKQVAGQYYLDEKLKVFLSDRDNYFIGAGEVDGFQIGATLRRLLKLNEYSIGGSFRKAQSAINEISEIIAVTGETRIRVVEKGDIRNSVELYRQNLQNVSGLPSYLLTDNKRGTKGLLWSSSFNYNVRRGMRINLRLSGRHSDESTARITGRGEVVAEF